MVQPLARKRILLLQTKGSIPHSSFPSWKCCYCDCISNWHWIIHGNLGFKINGTHENIHIVKYVPQMEISASFIRDSIKQGKDVSYLMPEKAWKYTDEMNFYR